MTIHEVLKNIEPNQMGNLAYDLDTLLLDITCDIRIPIEIAQPIAIAKQEIFKKYFCPIEQKQLFV